MNGSTRPRIRRYTWLAVITAAALAMAHGAAAVQQAAGPASKATARAQYLANAGVLVTHGDTKVVFDPLFRNDFGIYELVPQQLERALFAGQPPFDGLDAVFVSHYHDDHFSAVDVLRLLEARPEVRLVAPAQAVAAIRAIAGTRLDAVLSRVNSIALAYQGAPVALTQGPLLVEAVRIPHSGWPTRQQQVENIAYRVTLDSATTVVHLGDADTGDAHYARDAAYWGRRRTDVAFPPYWYLTSSEGRGVLERRIAARRSIGVHVPAEVPDRTEARAPEFRGVELFTQPGEVRDIR